MVYFTDSKSYNAVSNRKNQCSIIEDTPGLRYRNTIEVVLPFEVQFVSDDDWRCVESLVKTIDRQYFEIVGVFEYHHVAVAICNVDSTRRADWGRVQARQSFEPLARVDRCSG